MNIILASASMVRARLLQNAGLAFTIIPSQVDEDLIKLGYGKALASASETAMALATAKAQAVSLSHAGAYVIGADQMLDCEGRLFDKPVNREEARGHLGALRGRTHQLLTACVIVKDGLEIWQHMETPRLTMRAMSDDFIETYLDQVGDDALSSVGAYQLEGRGGQLFETVEGDYFSILGLPLLPLLGFLRAQSVIET
ncbi:MAG: Maf family nucleotide pyrophosphatase [Proteobacteria bacterium]|nr:Maf family nucleotide pyrophosphatase [Pseudomonadota bacterium]